MKENKILLERFQSGMFVMLAQDLNSLIDKGASIPVNDVYRMCSENKLIDWLDENCKSSMSMWDDDTKKIMAVEFDSFANCYTADDFGVYNNGIAFIIVMCLQFIINKPSRTIKDI